MNNMKETASPMSLKLTMMRRSKDQLKGRKPSQKLSINFLKKMSYMNMKGDTILNKLSKGETLFLKDMSALQEPPKILIRGASKEN